MIPGFRGTALLGGLAGLSGVILAAIGSQDYEVVSSTMENLVKEAQAKYEVTRNTS